MLAVMMLALTTATLTRADTGTCGGAMFNLPFTDVPGNNIFFCSIAEAFFTGLTNGTTPTTYSPSASVPREQMAAFITRTLDQSLSRGSRRAALQQWWMPTATGSLRSVELGSAPAGIVSDGMDLWVTLPADDSVVQLEGNTGLIKKTLTGFAPTLPDSIIACAGRIFVVCRNGLSAGRVFVINPEIAAQNTPPILEHDIGATPLDVTFDGTNLWTANLGSGVPGSGSISRIRVGDGLDNSFFAGLVAPRSILWDGAALWALDLGDDTLKEINASTGGVISSLSVPADPLEMIFDGTNLWIASNAGSITIVRAVGGLRGTVIQTITGNGLSGCSGVSFDGERVLVVNNSADSVSLFKATDFTPLGSLSVTAGTNPAYVCSDGLNFWITRPGSNDIIRF